MRAFPAYSMLRRVRGIRQRRPGVRRVIAAMRDRGLTLHCELGCRGSSWCLSDGHGVEPAVAKLAITNPDIVSVGGALFADVPAQTYRFISSNHGGENV